MTDLTAVNASAVTEAATLADSDFLLSAVGGVTRKSSLNAVAAWLQIDSGSAEDALASAASAAASAAAAGAASGRLDVGSFAQLSSAFNYDGTGGRQLAAAGDIILWREMDFAYEVLASGASGAHLDYTGTGGVKLTVLPGSAGGLSAMAWGVDAANTAALNTTRGQAAINAAQDSCGLLTFGAGIINTNGWTYNGNKPLTIRGVGRSSYAGSPSAVVELATVFNLQQTNGKIFDNTSGANEGFNAFEDFSVVNDSGSVGTTTFLYSENLVFTSFKNINGSGFRYGVRAQWSVYLKFDFVEFRDTDYPFDLTNINKTPPLILNALSGSGFFNNAITMNNCGAIDCIDGYRIAGVTIVQTACDVSIPSGRGWVIGGSDYNLTSFEGYGLYTESAGAIAFECTNADVLIGNLFLGQNNTIGIKATSSNVRVGVLRSYAAVAKGVESVNSIVEVFSYGGTITTPWTHSGTGFVRFLSDEYLNLATASLNDTQTVTVTLNSATGRIWRCSVFGLENGLTRYAFDVIVEGNTSHIIGTKPANLTVTTPINGSGVYDIRVANTAGFPYNFSVNIKPQVLHASVSL
jgi:hypothetical protein